MGMMSSLQNAKYFYFRYQSICVITTEQFRVIGYFPENIRRRFMALQWQRVAYLVSHPWVNTRAGRAYKYAMMNWTPFWRPWHLVSVSGELSVARSDSLTYDLEGFRWTPLAADTNNKHEDAPAKTRILLKTPSIPV